MANPVGTLSDTQIASIVESYRLQMARYEKLADFVGATLRRELRNRPVDHLLGARVKSAESLRKKLERKRHKYRWEQLSPDLNREVTDLAGCRIIVYVPEDVNRAVEAVVGCSLLSKAKHADAAAVRYGPEWPEEDGRHRKRYRATHLLVSPNPDSDGVDSIAGAICEVQVTTVAALLCNQLEHDTDYKDAGAAPSEIELHLLNSLSSIGCAADLSAAAFHREREEHLARNRREHEEPIQDAYALRFACEKVLGRPLRGEFSPLLRFLETTSPRLTHQYVEGLLASLPRPQAADDRDDVTQLFLSIAAQRPGDVRAWVEGWPAYRSALRRRLKEELERSPETP